MATTSAAASTDPLHRPPKAELDTPSLLLDLGRFERNVERLLFGHRGRRREPAPPFEGPRVASIARRQMDYGAIGVTCAKVSEAEVMVDGGVPSILIAYALATKTKLERAARLRPGPRSWSAPTTPSTST